MAYETFETKVKDRTGTEVTVATSTIPARKALKISSRLLTIFSSLLAALPSNVKEGITANVPTEKKFPNDLSDGGLFEKEIDFSKLSKALIENLQEEKVESLVLSLLVTTRVNGQDVSRAEIFDMVFTADFGLMMGCLKFVLEVNFKSFFTEEVIAKVKGLWNQAVASREM